MHGYTEFVNDVNELYRFLMDEYEFRMVSQSSLEVVLQSPRCIVSISTEYDYAQFVFKSSEQERWMFLGPSLEKYYPEVQLPDPPSANGLTREQRIRAYLEYQARIVKAYGRRILEGDFGE